jgi:hypothetical protein
VSKTSPQRGLARLASEGKQTYKREEQPRTRKRKVEEERATEVELPSRPQLPLSVEALLLEDDDYHTPETCWRCAMEEDPDYDVGEDGLAYCKGTRLQ